MFTNIIDNPPGGQEIQQPSAESQSQTAEVTQPQASRKNTVRTPHHKSSKRLWHRILCLAFFPLSLFYMETIFHFSVSSGLNLTGAGLTLLYCGFAGLLEYLIVLAFPTPRGRSLSGCVILILSAVPFVVEYFVAREFKVLYNLKTILNGAGGVATGFMGDVLRMVFSFQGLLHIFLFLLPYLLYLFFMRPLVYEIPRTSVRMLFYAAGMVTCLLVCLLCIFSSSHLYSLYRTNYSFTNSVETFGLLDSLRLEVMYYNRSGSEFITAQSDTTDSADPPENETVSSDSSAPSSDPVTGASSLEQESTGAESSALSQASGENSSVQADSGTVTDKYNQMNIDFEAIKTQTDSDTVVNLCDYASSLKSSNQNEYTGLFEGKNLIMICAEAFSGYLIDEQLTPTLYRMATKGMQFTDFYQPASAGTTGGEVELLLGLQPMDGGESMANAVSHNMFLTMGSRLNALGYYGLAMHANDYTFYDRNITHNLLGYSEGFMGYGSGMEQYVELTWPESDLEALSGTFSLYADKSPFNIYYMSVSGHGGYSLSDNAMVEKHWDEVQDLPYSDTVKGYIACNLELEDALTVLIEDLEQAGLADDTVIVLCADHFPYGLDDDAPISGLTYLNELYGFTVTNYLERDQNRLLIWSGCLEDQEPIVVSDPTMSLDVLPTLLNLWGITYDSRLLPGRDVFSDTDPLVYDVNGDWKTVYGTYISSTDTFTPAEGVEASEITDAYIASVTNTVWNKLRYSSGIMDTEFYDLIYAQIQDQLDGGK